MIIQQLKGQPVKVTFRGMCRLAVQGTLKEYDEVFLSVDQGVGEPIAFIPLTAVLLVESHQEK